MDLVNCSTLPQNAWPDFLLAIVRVQLIKLVIADILVVDGLD